jgi:hypothetical protein
MKPETIVKRDADAVYLKTRDSNIWREPNRREGTDNP